MCSSSADTMLYIRKSMSGSILVLINLDVLQPHSKLRFAKQFLRNCWRTIGFRRTQCSRYVLFLVILGVILQFIDFLFLLSCPVITLRKCFSCPLIGFGVCCVFPTILLLSNYKLQWNSMHFTFQLTIPTIFSFTATHAKGS